MIRHPFFLLIALFALYHYPVFADETDTDAATVGGYSKKEALKLGERMYREGILPSGKPMKALVMGDVPVDGRMFTCDDCHQRSGLGSEEGTIITYPINGKELFIPRRRTGAARPSDQQVQPANPRAELPEYFKVKDDRPAYTVESLGRVIRIGMDPTGRRLDPIMPKYILGKANMEILIHYLKNLSSEISPGVDDTTIKFATVIAGDVPNEKEEAMLSVLQAHIDARNSQSRHEDKRAASGPFYKTEMYQSYRRLSLQVWRLQGPQDTWRQQLDGLYAQEPVFALLGGISSDSWAPVHEFSEENRIPCIFPITDLPVVSDSDWYTLYFSKGYAQEAETAAKYLRTRFSDLAGVSIVQIFSSGDKASSTLASTFREVWTGFGGKAAQEVDINLSSTDELPETLKTVLTEPHQAVLLWLNNDSQEIFKLLETGVHKSASIFVSATLLNEQYDELPGAMKQKVLVTFPRSSAEEDSKSRSLVKRWLKVRKIPAIDFETEAKMYFLGWMLPGALKSMRSEFYRDYFLERFDMMIDQDYSIAVYPRLTFGPGQRYASKGCYIARLQDNAPDGVVPVSDWVIH